MIIRPPWSCTMLHVALEVNCLTALIPSQSTAFVQSQFKEEKCLKSEENNSGQMYRKPKGNI